MAIITRAQWGARKARAVTPVYWTPGGAAWVHYRGASVGSPIPATPAGEAAEMRAIQRYHQDGHGWNDIGYSYVVFPSGRVYEGRGRNVLASHCPGHNTEMGVCLIWDDGARRPPAVALNAVLDLARSLDRRTLRGHRDGYSTSCPGDAIYSWVVANRAVGRPRPVPVATPPWTFRVAGKGVVARGALTAPIIAVLTGHARQKGHAKPWVATVEGREIGRGSLWPAKGLRIQINKALYAGKRVNINGANKQDPRGAIISIAKESV